MPFQKYKPAKTTKEQIDYLENYKRVVFDSISKEEAEELLRRYGYLNIITPYKHHFAKTDSKHGVIKTEDNKHIYEREIDFGEYFAKFKDERTKYPIIINNIMNFEMHFKSIQAYHILSSYDLGDSDKLYDFLDSLLNRSESLLGRYKPKRVGHMRDIIENLKSDIFKYADIYCFFDRMSLGTVLTIYTCLENNIQEKILNDMVRYSLNFNVQKVPDFIEKVFCLVSIRNCVMHCNSLEILVRFYNPKEKNNGLRKRSDRKKYISMIKELSIEKAHVITRAFFRT